MPAHITHVTTDLGALPPRTQQRRKAARLNPTAEEFRLINTILRGWKAPSYKMMPTASCVRLRSPARTSLTRHRRSEDPGPEDRQRQRAKNLHTS